MKFRSIQIRGFGMLSETSIETLEEGLVLFEGPNGAGKSTFLAFLNSIIFGYERGASGKYAETHGALRGGVVSIETKDGRKLIWERGSVPPASGSLKVQFGGAPMEVADLLGSANRDMYGSVFALGIDQLRADEFAADRQSAIEAAITGMGVKGLPQALTGMAKEASKLDKEVRAALSELEDSDELLEKAKAGTRRYDEILEASRTVRSSISELESQAESAKTKSKKLDRMESAWSIWCSRESSRGLLDQMPAVASLEDGSLERLRSSRDRAERAKAELAELGAETEAIRKRLAETTVDAKLLESRAEIESLGAMVHAVREAEMGIETREAGVEEAKRALRSILLEFGSDWDEARVQKIDTSLVAQTEGAKIARSIADLRQSLQRLRDEMNSRIRERQDAISHLETLRSKLDSEDTVVTLEEAERQSDLLEQTRSLLSKIEIAESRPSSPDWTKTRVLILAAMLAVMAIAIATKVYWLILVGAAGGFAIGVVLAPKAATRSVSSETEELKTRLAEICKAEGWVIASVEDVSRIQREIRLARDTALQRQGRSQRVVEAEEAVHRLSHFVERAECDVEGTEGALQAAILEWQGWCAVRGYPSNLGDESLAPFESRVVKARSAIDDVHKAQELLAQFASRLEKTEVRLTALISSLVRPKRVGSVSDGIAELSRLLADAIESDRTIRETKKQLEGLDVRQSAAQREWDAATALASDLLKVAGVETDAEFEKIYEDSKQAIQIRSEFDKSTALLLQISGPGELDQLCLDLESVEDGLTLSTLAAEARQALREVSERLRAESDELIRLETNLENLEVGADLGAALAHRAERKAELDAIRRRWLEATLARLLLTEAREKFQSQVQEAVLDRASHYMRLLTDGVAVEIKKEDAGYFLLEEDGTRRNLSQLNRSQVERLLLAVRFGYIDQYCERREPLPVVLDDILVNFDPRHQALAAKAIADFAERHQVIYLTCHPSTVEMFKTQVARHQLVRLDRWKFIA